MNKILLILIIILLATNLILVNKWIGALSDKVRAEWESEHKEKEIRKLLNRLKKEPQNIESESEIGLTMEDFQTLNNEESKQKDLTITNTQLKDEVKNFKEKEEFIPNFFPIKGDYFKSKGFTENHPAFDYSTELNEKIYAAASGVIEKVAFDKNLGFYIVLDHFNGYETKYAHLKANDLKEKFFLNKGELLGQVGLTGNTDGPHLHFELKKNNKNIKPIFKIRR